MKQLTDEVQAQLIADFKLLINESLNLNKTPAASIYDSLEVLRNLSAVPTTQPVQVNAMLVEALEQEDALLRELGIHTNAWHAPIFEKTQAALTAAQQVAEPSYAAIHMEHCFQPPYETSCKYGDSDCPAQQAQPEPLTDQQFAEYFHPRTFVCSCGKTYNLPPKQQAQPEPKMVTPYITQEHFDRAFPDNRVQTGWCVGCNPGNCQGCGPAAQQAQGAFDAGFRCAAGWAQRDDLFADIDSPTYKKDRSAYIAAIKQGGQHEVA